MNGITKYFILKKSTAKLNTKSNTNTHLFFIPMDTHHYMYLGLIGQLTDEDNTYAAQLFVKLPEDILEDTIAGEYEFFDNRLEEMESLECSTTSPSAGKYIITFPKKGVNIKSDLEIEYKVEYSTSDKRIYFVKGDLNLVAGEVEEDKSDMSQIAARQIKIMGGKKRLKEMNELVHDRILFEISCKESLMRIVQESQILNKKISSWQKNELYKYIKEMKLKEISSLFLSDQLKVGAAAILSGAGALYLYRKLSDPCIKNYPLNSKARHECQMIAIKNVITQLESDKQHCSNTPKPDECRAKINEELDKWKTKYEQHLLKLSRSRGKASLVPERLKNAKI